jgi:hypothetical protein
MGDLSDFLQNYWFELGSLIAQFGILVVIAWYARTSLRAGGVPQRQAVRPVAARSEAQPEFEPAEPESAPAVYGGVGRMLSPMPDAPALHSEAAAPRRVKRTNPWRAMIKWLRAPMTIGTRARSAA